ncbi:NAD(P)-binding protein [Auriculariales sp. MPI-PUGE-AT-0066]|nr:NAD(P)-binding protein [Auriculariales sp. MPI-PUGE-AT-0066]
MSNTPVPPPKTLKVIVTGASGVLGNAILRAFQRASQDSGYKYSTLGLGLAHSRPGPGLKAFDLLDEVATQQAIEEFAPNWVIHCAAERRPEVVEKNPENTQKLNGELPGRLAALAIKHNFVLMHVSSDYIFDGLSPPYSPSSTPNPVNLYGRTKLGGEKGVLGHAPASGPTKLHILRVPVLYGPAANNSDSAVNVLVDVVRDQTGKTYKMDHYANRFPTNVLDIAGWLVRVTQHPKPLPPILHYSAGEPFTKYEMCLIFARLLNLPHAHIIPETEAPTGPTVTLRPKDSQLSVLETDALGIEGGLGLGGFEEWWDGWFKSGEWAGYIQS